MINLFSTIMLASLFAEASAEYLEDENFSPLIGIVFLLIICAIICILVGIGIVIALLVVGLSAAMVGFGVVTTSGLIGLHSGNVSSGVKALILQIFAVAGLVLGLGIACLIYLFAELNIRWYMLGIAGAISGIIGGLILAFGFNALWPRWVAFLKVKFDERSAKRLESQ